jgi:hypothetical protein
MKERYRKVLIQKLDEYLPSDVATQMLEADLEGKAHCVCVCVHARARVCVCVGAGGGGGQIFM